MEYDVTIDRDKYIGGSDISAIMGLSSFKTRWELLLEKAKLKEVDFSGNRYTEYGKIIEPQIRNYINEKYNTNFEPNRVINGDIRYHSDGFNGDCVLEVKSTSDIFDSVEGYQHYLVQLLKGMEENKVDRGILAVYERPEDFDTVFDAERLHIYEIEAEQYKSLLASVNLEIERFREDLKRLKENPLLTEADFQPNEIVSLSNMVVIFESRLAEYKAIEKQCKEMKQALFEAMEKHNVKSWSMPNGTKITRVDGLEATEETVLEFDTEAFKADNAELYEKYQKPVVKKKSGRAGYVKITLS